jgi:hypothetical protein
MREAPRQVHRSIQQLSEYLGLPLGSILKRPRLERRPGCFSMDDFIELQRLGGLPPSVALHLKTCEVCVALWLATRPCQSTKAAKA